MAKRILAAISFLMFIALFFVQPVLAQDHLPSLRRVTLPTQTTDQSIAFTVYVPPDYDPNGDTFYPTLYLLHGHDMDETIWEAMGLPETLADGWEAGWLPPFFVVAIREENSLQDLYYSEFDDAILNTVIPWVDQTYHTCVARECRAIGGISRGALWAGDIAFRHADLFSAVGMHSLPGALFDPQSLKVLRDEHFANHQLLRVLIDIGSEDGYRVQMRDLIDELIFLGYPFTSQIHLGGHDRAYWERLLPDYLKWYAADWFASDGQFFSSEPLQY